MKICTKCQTEFDNIDWKCPNCEFVPNQIEGITCLAASILDSFSSDGYDSKIFSMLFDLESRNFWFTSRNQIILWMLNRYGSYPSQSLLEIGCGTGYVLSAVEKKFPSFRVFGSEIFVEGLQYAKLRVRHATLLQMDARNIPFRSEFDIVCAFDVLEHIEEDVRVLQQINKSLKEGGKLFITVPQHSWLWSPADEYARHVRRYECKDLLTKIRRSGFKILRKTSFVTFLLPLMLVSRILAKRNERFNPLKELRVSRFLNSLLSGILSMERYFITHDVSFAWGGSLFVVAQKISNLEDVS